MTDAAPFKYEDRVIPKRWGNLAIEKRGSVVSVVEPKNYAGHQAESWGIHVLWDGDERPSWMEDSQLEAEPSFEPEITEVSKAYIVWEFDKSTPWEAPRARGVGLTMKTAQAEADKAVEPKTRHVQEVYLYETLGESA